MVGYIQGNSSWNFTIQVGAGKEYNYAIVAHPPNPEYTPTWSPLWTVAITPVGGSAAATYTHRFLDQEEWLIEYNGIISGPGGAGDLN